MSIKNSKWLWITGLSKTTRSVEILIFWFFFCVNLIGKWDIIVLTGAYRPMMLRYTSNPTNKTITQCKLSAFSSFASLTYYMLMYIYIYISCFVDFRFLLIMLIFFLFLVSGHYGPDAFFNSGCKCVLVFSDYLINHQKLSCLLSLTYWLEGKKKWLNDWFLLFFYFLNYKDRN